MSHFYLTLPSNSSANYYDDNTLTKFTTRLQSSMSLRGEWEVGLSEIIFPHTWLTLSKEDATFQVNWLVRPEMNSEDNVQDIFHVRDETFTELYRDELSITPGYYDSITEILREMNDAIVASRWNPLVSQTEDDPLRIFPQLKYNETSKRATFLMQKNQAFSFSKNLATILGVMPNQNPSKPNLYDDGCLWEGEAVCDLSVGINYMMVYCDLLEHVPVGDTKAPLLRIVDASGSNGAIVHRTFDDARYIPLQKKHFDSIEIDIRDDLGKPIAFENGKLVVTLHFRQSESSYFLG